MKERASMTAEVDFLTIADDYAAFMSFTNETAAQIAALRLHLDAAAAAAESWRMLDFGCGDGSFAASLLKVSETGQRPAVLHLVEPVDEQRRQAAGRLICLVDKVVDEGTEPTPDGPRIGLIIANHCLYYVPDSAAAVSRLLDRLAPGGTLVAALLDRQNALAQLWQAGFAAMKSPFPFPLAEDIAVLCRCHDAEVTEERIAYRIAFEDTEANRVNVLRFLFGDNLVRLDPATAFAVFEPWCDGNRIVMETSYPHLVVRRSTQSALT
ncbi:MAG: methyltransferase domain-containing protein [Rhodospirillales bacterium]|nr:methyltransferase domain-containing protein [Rhodospirillales bacterium]